MMNVQNQSSNFFKSLTYKSHVAQIEVRSATEEGRSGGDSAAVEELEVRSAAEEGRSGGDSAAVEDSEGLLMTELWPANHRR